MRIDTPPNDFQKRTGVAILIEKMNFKTKCVTREKEVYFTMIKGLIHL